jgi:HlyD family secretion protein
VEQTRQEVILAQQGVELAQKSLIQAGKDLEEATISAPFDGTVVDIGVKEGEYVSTAAYAWTTIIELLDEPNMELIARVLELDIARIKTGQKVMVAVDAVSEMKLEGRVAFISPVAREPGTVLFEDEDEEKEYEVKIEFKGTVNSLIRDGMSATAEIIVE